MSISSQLPKDNRILLLSHIGCPPPYEGSNARVMALIKGMRRLGYEVHFAGICMSKQAVASTQPSVDQWVGNFEGRPLPSLNIFARIKRKVRRLFHRLEWVEDRLDEKFCEPWLAEACDLQRRSQYRRVLLIYVFYSKFLQAFPDPCLRILDAVDVFSNRRQRLRVQGVQKYWRSFAPRDERRGLLRAHRVIAIQNHEAAYFRQLLGSAAEVRTVGHLGETLNTPPPPASWPRLGCIGSAHPSNVDGLQWFLREVWPRIQEGVLGAELCIAGSIGENCPVAPAVRLLGPVRDLAEIYRECPVFINPMHSGTGLKIKIIEALMHGRPVVTTSVGAEGLESFKGQGLFVCDTAEEFARGVVTLLSNLSAAQDAGEAALRQAQKYMADNYQSLAEVLST